MTDPGLARLTTHKPGSTLILSTRKSVEILIRLEPRSLRVARTDDAGLAAITPLSLLYLYLSQGWS